VTDTFAGPAPRGPITLLVAHGDLVVRVFVRDALKNADIKVIGEASDGAQAVRLALERTPQVVLIDPSLPRLSGIEAGRRIKQAHPWIRLVALAASDGEHLLEQASRAGFTGFVLHDEADFLADCVRRVHDGESVISPGLGLRLMKAVTALRESRQRDGLTAAERAVLRLLADRLTYRQIAQQRSTTLDTVKKQVSAAYRKLGVTGRREALESAGALGVLDETPAGFVAGPRARTAADLREEIEKQFGFFPPFFIPALDVPPVLQTLWQATLAGYVDNPLPAVFKEKLFAYLSRYCRVPYCIVCHSCALRPLGMRAAEVLKLLEAPPPDDRQLLEHDLPILARCAGQFEAWPDPGVPVEDALLRGAVAIFLGHSEADTIGHEMRRLLGAGSYQSLVVFLGYVKTCHIWVEAHPELAYEADQRVADNLGRLIEEDPGLGEFFENYRERVRAEVARRRRSDSESAASEHLAAMVASCRDAIVTATLDGIVSSWNGGAERLYGYAAEEMIGRHIWSIVPPDRLAEVQTSFRRLCAGEDLSYETVRLHKDATPVDVWVTASPVCDSSGRVVAASAIARNLGDRMPTERFSGRGGEPPVRLRP